MPGGFRTEKQAAILRKYGYNSEVPFDQAGATIDQLKRNGWKPGPPQGQYGAPQQQQGALSATFPQTHPQQPPQNTGGCTQKQAGILAKYGYPTNVSFDTASQIIDQLKANNWQPVNAGFAAPQQQLMTPPATPPQFVPPGPPPAYAPPQYAPPAVAQPYPTQPAPVPQFTNGQNPPWEGQPQFSGVPNFG